MSNLKDAYVADLERLIEIEAQLKDAKLLYQEYDVIVMRLLEQGFKEATHLGHMFRITDNFAEKNTAFRMAFVKRYEIKVTEVK